MNFNLFGKKRKRETKLVKHKTKVSSGKSTSEQPDFLAWYPSLLWYAKVFGCILIILIVLFFLFNLIFKPYMRTMSYDITTWLQP